MHNLRPDRRTWVTISGKQNSPSRGTLYLDPYTVLGLKSRLCLDCISTVSRLYLDSVLTVSRLYLVCV